LRDIFMDVGSIAGTAASTAPLNSMYLFQKDMKRFTRQMISSCDLNFTFQPNGRPRESSSQLQESSLAYPQKEIGIRFLVSTDNFTGSPNDAFLQFPSPYLLWVWLKWLTFSQSYWARDTTNLSDPEELPPWVILNNCHISSATLSLHTQGQVYTGRILLDITQPHKLICEHGDGVDTTLTLDLRVYSRIQSSLDAIPWKPIRLQIDKIVVKSGSTVIGQNNNVVSSNNSSGSAFLPHHPNTNTLLLPARALTSAASTVVSTFGGLARETVKGET
jgi:hypothetical protein